MYDLCMIDDGRSGGTITISSSSMQVCRCVYLIHILIMDSSDNTQKKHCIIGIIGMYVQLLALLKE